MERAWIEIFFLFFVSSSMIENPINHYNQHYCHYHPNHPLLSPPGRSRDAKNIIHSSGSPVFFSFLKTVFCPLFISMDVFLSLFFLVCKEEGGGGRRGGRGWLGALVYARRWGKEGGYIQHSLPPPLSSPKKSSGSDYRGSGATWAWGSFKTFPG